MPGNVPILPQPFVSFSIDNCAVMVLFVVSDPEVQELLCNSADDVVLCAVHVHYASPLFLRLFFVAFFWFSKYFGGECFRCNQLLWPVEMRKFGTFAILFIFLFLFLVFFFLVSFLFIAWFFLRRWLFIILAIERIVKCVVWIFWSAAIFLL